MDIAQQKKQIRQQVLTSLKQMSTSQREHASAQLVEKIAQFLNEHPSVRTISTFANLAIEPDLSALHRLFPQHRFVYPLCLKDRKMEFYHVAHPDEMNRGTCGIREPDPDTFEHVRLDEIDCFLCPSFAYTEQGDRLGKGGGYYDRALSNRKKQSHLLGVAFAVQMMESVPTEKHDQAVDQVIYA